MAIYEVEGPGGVIIEVEGPDNADPARVVAEAQRLFAQRQQPQPGAIPTAGAPPAPPAVAPAPVDYRSELARQLGLTVRAGVEGAAGLAGIFTDPVAAVINQFLPPERRMSTLRSAMTAVLTEAGIPNPRNEVERIINQAASTVAGGGGQVGAARLVQAAAGGPVTQAVAGQLAAQPVAQLVSSATGGAAAQTVQEAGGGPAEQALAALVAGTAGAQAAAPRAARPPAMASDIEAARRAGVRVMTSDVMPPETGVTRGIQRVAEGIPGAGTTGPRLAQQQERVDAVRNLLRDFNAASTTASDDIMRDLAMKRSADLRRYTADKNDVITRLSDPTKTVPVPRAEAAIDTQIARLESASPTQFAPIIDRLRQFKTDLTGMREVAQPNGTTVMVADGKQLKDIETLRRALGDAFKTPELAAIRTDAEKAISAIYAPLRDDMTDFISSQGQRRDATKWLVANKRLSDLAGDLDMTAFRSTLNRGDVTPEVVNNMLFSKRPSEVQQLYKSLTPQGRAAAQSAILSRAAEQSRVLQGADAVIDPTTFAREVDKLGTSVGIFFNKDDLKRVEGLTRVLNLTRRAGEVAAGQEKTQVQALTSISLLGAAGVGASQLYGLLSGVFGPLVGGAGTAATIGTLGASARIYESPAVRDILRRIPTTVPGSKEEAALIKRLLTATQATQEQP